MEKEKATMRHCKKCDFTSPRSGVLCQHYRHEHPKTKAAGKERAAKRTYKPRGGKTAPAGLQPANDKEAEHAFKALQKRANKGKLTEEQTTVFDNIEPSVIGKKASDWPDGYKESVIKLFKDVTNED